MRERECQFETSPSDGDWTLHTKHASNNHTNPFCFQLPMPFILHTHIHTQGSVLPNILHQSHTHTHRNIYYRCECMLFGVKARNRHTNTMLGARIERISAYCVIQQAWGLLMCWSWEEHAAPAWSKRDSARIGLGVAKLSGVLGGLCCSMYVHILKQSVWCCCDTIDDTICDDDEFATRI